MDVYHFQAHPDSWWMLRRWRVYFEWCFSSMNGHSRLRCCNYGMNETRAVVAVVISRRSLRLSSNTDCIIWREEVQASCNHLFLFESEPEKDLQDRSASKLCKKSTGTSLSVCFFKAYDILSVALTTKASQVYDSLACFQQRHPDVLVTFSEDIDWAGHRKQTVLVSMAQSKRKTLLTICLTRWDSCCFSSLEWRMILWCFDQGRSILNATNKKSKPVDVKIDLTSEHFYPFISESKSEVMWR